MQLSFAPIELTLRLYRTNIQLIYMHQYFYIFFIRTSYNLTLIFAKKSNYVAKSSNYLLVVSCC